MPRSVLRAALCFALAASALGADLPTPQLKGNVSAAYDVVERLIPGAKAHFKLSIVGGCAGVAANTPCFVTSNGADGTVDIAATSASELTFAIGEYVKQKREREREREMRKSRSDRNGARVRGARRWPSGCACPMSLVT